MEEPKKDTPAENSGLLRELEDIRSRHRLFKIAAVVFSVIFIVVVVFAVLLYRKISAAKETFTAMEQAFPVAGLVKAGAENNTGVFASGLSLAGGSPSSSLTVFTNVASLASEGAQGPPAVDPVKARNALAKYRDHPVVKEFVAELEKDPSFRKALADSGGNNPIKVLSSLRNIKGMDKIVAKFAVRPDFMKLMMEAMSDPELKPLMRGLPRPGIPLPNVPDGELLPAAARGRTYAEAEQPASGAEIKFDPSAVSGGAQNAPASGAVIQPVAVKRKAPPPIR